jgi:hypothetical protein
MAVQPTQTAVVPQATPTSSYTNSDGSLNYDNLLGAGLIAGAGIYGATTGSSQVAQGEQNAINTQQGAFNTVKGIYGAQNATGNAAIGSLADQLGLTGKAPDYSAFQNSPGYQFAVNQGTQAINRQASANGSLYTPNTLTAVGQYVTGTASQNYNTYMQNLLAAAGLGSQANAAQSNAALTTSANIGQLQQNQGNANASGTAGTVGSLIGGLGGASGLGNLIKGIGGAVTGANSSGVDMTLDPSITGVGGANDAYSTLSGDGSYLNNVPGIDYGTGDSSNP